MASAIQMLDDDQAAVTTESGALGSPVLVRTLDDSWIDRAGEVLALSFVDEPVYEWMLGGTPRWRRRVMALSFRASVHGRRHSIELHGAFLSGRLVGVGVRFPPGRWPPTRWESIRGSPWRMVGMLVRLTASRRSIRLGVAASTVIHRLHQRHPPHWYLWLMGVHPGYRRHGVASALARYVIQQADEAGVGCYLETFGDATEVLYRDLGFEVEERFVAAPGAPPGRTMWRDPVPVTAGCR
jgi:GNAT superfamily N-acetyltransferase